MSNRNHRAHNSSDKLYELREFSDNTTARYLQVAFYEKSRKCSVSGYFGKILDRLLSNQTCGLQSNNAVSIGRLAHIGDPIVEIEKDVDKQISRYLKSCLSRLLHLGPTNITSARYIARFTLVVVEKSTASTTRIPLATWYADNIKEIANSYGYLYRNYPKVISLLSTSLIEEYQQEVASCPPDRDTV